MAEPQVSPARRRAVPVLYAVFVLMPLYWLIIISLMTQEEATAGLSFFPKEPTLNNYREALFEDGVLRTLINSLIVVVRPCSKMVFSGR